MSRPPWGVVCTDTSRGTARRAAGALAEAGVRAKLERLCRYIARRAEATKRLLLTAQG